MLPHVISELFFLVILPIMLVKLHIIPPRWRVQTIVLVFLSCLVVLAMRDVDLGSIGFTDDNLPEALELYAVAAALGIAAVFGLAKLYRNQFEKDWYRDTHKIVLFLPLSFMQQFVFQGFILNELLRVTTPGTAVIITAALFGYMHTIYPHPVRNLAITAIAGLYFASLYLIIPNLIAITLAHAVLNFMLINFGFFTYPEGMERTL
jgi:membrane protease YdiL (CAAX protease family)